MKALSSAAQASNPPMQHSIPLLGSSPYRLKQVSRIIRHLREQLHQSHPKLAKPSGAVIEAMLEGCPAILLSGDDWQQIIGDILVHLQKRFQARPQQDPLVQCGRPHSGLLIDELFDEHDAFLFISALLEQHRQAVC